MKVYEVECRAVITLAAQDMQQAALRGPAVIKDNPHLIYVRAVRERHFKPAGEDPRVEHLSVNRNLAGTAGTKVVYG
jgi:hypothetical protein